MKGIHTSALELCSPGCSVRWYTAACGRTGWMVSHTDLCYKETPKRVLCKLTGSFGVGFSVHFRKKPHPTQSVCGFWVPAHRLLQSLWCEPGVSKFILPACSSPCWEKGTCGEEGEGVCVCKYEYRGWPYGFMNNRYFPLYPEPHLKSSGVVIHKKGLSWPFLSWCRLCMYAHIKDPHLFSWGGFVCMRWFFFFPHLF